MSTLEGERREIIMNDAFYRDTNDINILINPDSGVMSTNILKLHPNARQIHVFLFMIADYCSQQSKLHEKARLKYRFLNYGIAIPSIVLSTIAGSVNLVNAVSIYDNNSPKDIVERSISIICGISGLISATMLSIHRYANLAELEYLHAHFVDSFEKQNLDIRSNIMLDSQNCNHTYTNLYEYLKFCKNEISILIEKSPPVPIQIKNNYKKNKSLIDISHVLNSNRN